MDSDTARIVANLNLKDIINNYNTLSYLIAHKQISSLSFVNLLHIRPIKLNVCKKMTDFKLLLWDSNTRNHLTVGRQMMKSK